MKTTDKELGNLLDILAMVLNAQVGEIQKELDEQGAETGNEYYTATPALLTVAARFLKDNNMTCAVEDNEIMSELKDKLAKRKKLGKNVVHISDADKLASGG